jgi:hypothetical protein
VKDRAKAKATNRWKRRGWRATLWGIAFVLLVQLTGGLLLDYRWPDIRFPAAARVLARCQSPSEGPVIVALGSSRFDGGILPGQITALLRDGTGEKSPRVVNLAVGCGDLIVAEHLLGKLREQGVKPAQVIVEVSPETLNDRNLWLDQHAYRQLTWADTFAYTTDMIRSGHYIRFWRSRLIPLYIHRDQIVRRAVLSLASEGNAQASKQTILMPPLQEDDIRWGDPRLKTDPVLRTEAGLDNIRRWLKHYRVGGAAAASLERIMQSCEKDGIPVLLVGVPVTVAHRNLYRPDIETAFLQHMRQVTQSHPHTRFLDLRAAIPDVGFSDNHHLTPDGAKQFSRLLTDKALLPQLRERHAAASSPETNTAREVARGP